MCTRSDFRQLNKQIVRKSYPIPKISTTLQELEGLTYATALDLNMGYYTIRLDPAAAEMCTIIFPWSKYSYQRCHDDHLDKLEQVFIQLQDAGHKVGTARTFFCTQETEYLGYILTRDGVSPNPKKCRQSLRSICPTTSKN